MAELTLQNILDEIEEMRRAALARDWTPPEDIIAPERIHSNAIEWREPEQDRPPTPVPLSVVRGRPGQDGEMLSRMKQYLSSCEREPGDRSPPPPVFLARVPAGGGKTHAAVELAQWWAEQGRGRVLWVAERHNMFYQLRNMPHFKPDLWLHFLPMHKARGETDVMATTCRHADEQHQWSNRGLPSFELCLQLCEADGWMSECPYRCQRQSHKPIIFARHEHMINGLMFEDFSLVVVDENPQSVFVQERHIPTSGIVVPGASGPVKLLMETLYRLCLGLDEKSTLSGRPLLDQIGPILSDVFAQVEFLRHTLPAIPRVNRAEDVRHVPYWYLRDLLVLASQEYDPWLHGWEVWNERIELSVSGMHLRVPRKLWDHLPYRTVALDATGRAGIYRAIFDRDVERYSPAVERQGRIYQVVNRLNGISTLLDQRGRLLPAGADLVQLAVRLSRRYELGRTGVICHKKMRPFFEEHFGEDMVMHFGNLRGSNSLEHVDCLVVAGAPAPAIGTAVRAASAIDAGRIKPYVVVGASGQRVSLFTEKMQEYRVTDAAAAEAGYPGRVPTRRVKGYWDEPILQTVYESYREAELVQAIHRGRVNVQACDVWVVTSVPTDEVLDGIYMEPPVDGPDGIHWRQWVALESWLDTQWAEGNHVSNEDLAEQSRAALTYVKNEKWLERICDYYDQEDRGRWMIMRLPRQGRPKVLVPVHSLGGRPT